MTARIRSAAAADVDSMLALAASRRQQYATYQPVFWRPAADAESVHRPHLAARVADPEAISLVATHAERLVGFLVGTMVPAPPVYEPGGLTCSVDDFALECSDLWASVGSDLLDAVRREARGRGAAQLVVVCGHLDDAKRNALADSGMQIASEWWVSSLSP